MSDKPTFRENVADEIIRHLEAGTAPWQKPWKAGVLHKRPFNPVTKKPYRGINSFWLDMSGHEDPRWMTFNQAKALGGSVQKGSKARSIEYWQWSVQKPVLDEGGKPVLDKDGKKTMKNVRLDRPRVFHAAVFNAEQIDGLEPYKAPDLTFDPVKDAEDILKSTGVTINHDQDDRAYYQRGSDSIHLPHPAAFDSPFEYYATALHEVGHATGAEHRMVREKGTFGSEVYAKEELMVEMASYMKGRELGLGHNPERHAAYVGSWLEAIKEDRNYLFQAAAVSEKIQTWVMEPENRAELERTTQQAFTQSKQTLLPDHGAQKEQNMENQQDKRGLDNEASKRSYLAVPFDENEDAKELGAKWDRKAKSWFVPEGVESEAFDKWKPDPGQPQKTELDPHDEFADFLKANGVELTEAPIMDGKWHRVKLEGDKFKKNASYRGFIDGVPNGALHNYKLDETSTWISTGRQMDPQEIATLKALAAEKSQQRQADLEQAQNQAARTSYGVWKNQTVWADKKNSPYLEAKDVNGYGIKMSDRGDVIIPLRDTDGRIHSLQFVDENKKLFTKDGRKQGLFHTIDPDQALKNKPKTIFIAEGYATAATVFEATKKPVAVAFDSGNLVPVAKALREKHPEAKIVIAADNDHPLEKKSPFKNVGLTKAVEAAEAIDGRVLSPKLTEGEIEKGLTDWNDLSQARGKDRLARQLNSDLKKALSPKKEKGKSMEMSL